ncbi:hypothetical protein VKT23_013327 [Stygiomarasmius scandens]|uniref:Cytochrome P450 n=1 Tax=Marasmiellus scandens TaxID=2682957 RepID=A0ABR1J6W2_9AGAR
MPDIVGFDVSPQILTLAFIGLVTLSIAQYYQSPWRKLPPGPKGLPLIGNALQLGKQQWLTFTEWRKEFGDIIYLNGAGQPLIILNSHKVATDLLDGHAGKTSARPGNYVADLLTGNLVIVFLGYTDVWRRMRKASHEGFNKAVVHRYHPFQFRESVLLTSSLIAKPVDWDNHLRRSAASSVMSVVYATPPVEENDPSVKNVNDHVNRLTRANLPGAHFVQFIPWLRYVPASLAAWKRNALEWHAHDSRMFGSLLKTVRDDVAKGTAKPSFAASLIEDQGKNNLSEPENAWLAGTMYAAGAETTAGAMSWYMLAMLAYPEVQKRAQAELDAVIGRSRVPTFTDFEHLPYIRALVKEVLRWRPVDPVGLPHRTTEDDWYEGRFIPKGSVLVPNVWCMNRDPEVYGPDAHHFNPARHLDKNGKLAPATPNTKDESHVSYGFGRRICVGRNVGNNSLFINIAIMLWTLKLERPTGPDGKVVPLDIDGCVEDGLVVRPKPFDVKITPRFPEAPAILAQEKDNLEY